ncbi:hypothetical protein DFH09DRAFT_1071586 [Mycena vulgaris]|nr:hypothetical protein DFH09DRAFT_1071586 [Mycena vulgaris]
MRGASLRNPGFSLELSEPHLGGNAPGAMNERSETPPNTVKTSLTLYYDTTTHLKKVQATSDTAVPPTPTSGTFASLLASKIVHVFSNPFQVCVSGCQPILVSLELSFNMQLERANWARVAAAPATAELRTTFVEVSVIGSEELAFPGGAAPA